MKLRPRLALTATALSLPVIASVVWVEIETRNRTREDDLVAYASEVMNPHERAQCEADPEAWASTTRPFTADMTPPRRPRPDDGTSTPRGDLGTPPPSRLFGVRIFPYDHNLQPSAISAPTLDPELVLAARNGAAVAHRGDSSGHEVLMQMAWSDGPCAYVLARRLGPVARWGFPPPTFFLLRGWFLPVAVVLAAIVIALGPLVRRIRKLTTAVRATASDHYRGSIAVDGDDEIAELAAAFDAAGREVRAHVDALEQRERTLREFLANTTHDVMTPLTVLQGHLSGLQKVVASGGAADPAILRAATDEAHYMASIIHNLGVAAKLEAGAPAFDPSPLDLGELVQRTVGRHRPIAKQHDVALECAVPEKPVIVHGDVTLLERAVSNVVDNAIRYNKSGGHVAVTLEAARGDSFRLRIFDDGAGIPEDERTALLERGALPDPARRRRPAGHGLGLRIALDVVSVHGFTLRLCESEYGGLEVGITGAVGSEALAEKIPRLFLREGAASLDGWCRSLGAVSYERSIVRSLGKPFVRRARS